MLKLPSRFGLFTPDLADVYWQIGTEAGESTNSNIYSKTDSQISNWQILIDGLAQL